MGKVAFYYKDDCDYANKRLNNTYVLNKAGNLFLVGSVHVPPTTKTGDKKPEKLIASGWEFTFGGVLKLDEPNWGIPTTECPAEELNLEPLSMGYLFSKRRGTGVFVARLPMRTTYKQGLYMGSLIFSSGGKSDIVPTELLMPIMNVYPSLTVAMSLAKKAGSTYPFSRNFAVDHEGVVHYRGQHLVGAVVMDGARPVIALSPKYTYLQQHLDWSLK